MGRSDYRREWDADALPMKSRQASGVPLRRPSAARLETAASRQVSTRSVSAASPEVRVSGALAATSTRRGSEMKMMSLASGAGWEAASVFWVAMASHLPCRFSANIVMMPKRFGRKAPSESRSLQWPSSSAPLPGPTARSGPPSGEASSLIPEATVQQACMVGFKIAAALNQVPPTVTKSTSGP